MTRAAAPSFGVFPADAKPARAEGPRRPEGDSQEQGPQQTPLLIPASEAARLIGVSKANWYRQVAAKKAGRHGVGGGGGR
jgi:hypothetical protein